MVAVIFLEIILHYYRGYRVIVLVRGMISKTFEYTSVDLNSVKFSSPTYIYQLMKIMVRSASYIFFWKNGFCIIRFG